MLEPYQKLVETIAPNLSPEDQEQMRAGFEQLFSDDVEETEQSFLRLWSQSDLAPNEKLKEMYANPEARWLAIYALGWLGDSEDAEWMISILEDLKGTLDELGIAVCEDVADQICKRHGRPLLTH